MTAIILGGVGYDTDQLTLDRVEWALKACHYPGIWDIC